MTTFGDSPVEHPVARLDALLERLEKLLARVVENPEGLVPEESHAELRAAWEVVAPRFRDARDNLPGVADELAAVGLVGPELDYKLSVIGYGFRKLDEKLDAMFSGGKRGLAKAAGLLGSVLGLVDVPLDSLPASVGVGAIKEFKGIIEYGATILSQVQEEDDDDEDDRDEDRPEKPKSGSWNL